MTEAALPAWTPAEWARTHWPQRMLTDYLDAAVNRHPDKAAIVDYNSMSGKATTLTFRQLQRIVGRMAAGLASMGVKKGTIVACQLPNWWQFVALYLACARLGAIINPLMPIFRQRELRYMLGFAEAEVMVVPRLFRGCDYPAIIAEIRADLPRLAHLLVIGGGDGEDSFERRLLDRRWEDEVDLAALFARQEPSPNDVTQLLYTSGTTGEPKGVMHTSNTLLSILIKYEERLGLGGDDIIFMASPMGHQAGFMYGLMMGPLLGAKLVLQDIWNADQAALLRRACDVIFEAVESLDRPSELRPYSVRLHAVEKDADAPFRRHIGRLFDGGNDVRSVLAGKDIYRGLETAIDRADVVGRVLDRIALGALPGPAW